MAGGGTRLFHSLYIAGIVSILALLLLWQKEASLETFCILNQHFCSSPPNAEVDLLFSSLLLVHRNVAVALSFGYHLDVLFSPFSML